MDYIIYKITNTVNGKSYIGFSSKTLKQRWRKHRHDAKTGRKTYLCNAIRKYGHRKFKKEILFETKILELAKSVMEEKFIKEHQTYWLHGIEYNMTMGGDGTLGHKHSRETREKMSKSHTGKKHTEITKKKLSKQRKGEGNPNYGRIFSKEYRSKIGSAVSGSKNGRAKRFLVTLPSGEQVKIEDRKGFCEQHNLKYNSVCSATRRGSPYQGYTFSEIKDAKFPH